MDNEDFKLFDSFVEEYKTLIDNSIYEIGNDYNKISTVVNKLNKKLGSLLDKYKYNYNIIALFNRNVLVIKAIDFNSYLFLSGINDRLRYLACTSTEGFLKYATPFEISKYLSTLKLPEA